MQTITRKASFPIAGGAPDIAASCGEIFITIKQSVGSMVDNIDFVTSFGHGRGGDHRPSLGMATRGPTRLMTDRAVWVSDPETTEFVVTTIHPGATRQSIPDSCGWKVRFSDILEETTPPTPLELATLRDLQRRTAAAQANTP